MDLFTVVIAEQDVLDSIRSYEPYLKPLLNDPQMSMCRWFPDGRDLDSAVPGLCDAVARKEDWRLIAVCDESGLERENPFDAVSPELPEQGEQDELTDWLSRIKEKKYAAFEKAAEQPLTRLATWLCTDPFISGKRLDPTSSFTVDGAENIVERREMLLYNEYLDESERKNEIRAGIRDGKEPGFFLPRELIAVARRTYTAPESNTRLPGGSDRQYSRFYDCNLYFDRMRYMIFDILPKNHNNYNFDYLRFLIGLMMLAGNETPAEALRPNRVYVLGCETNEEALRGALNRYDARMSLTQDILKGRIAEVEAREHPHLTDKEAARLFHNDVPVNVALGTPAGIDERTVPSRGLGLSGNCPEDEDAFWVRSFRSSRQAFIKFMRLPRRALRLAAQEMHEQDTPDLREAPGLNNFQLEDVRDRTEEAEMSMLTDKTVDVCDTSEYLARLDEKSDKVRKVISTRMTKKLTVAIGLTVIACCLVCFLPLVFANAESNLLTAFVLALGFAAAAAVCAVIILFCLRAKLKNSIRDYNNTVLGIESEIQDSMASYSRLLTHACSVLRGRAVVNSRERSGNPDEREVRVLKNHINDITRCREELRLIFGQYVDGASAAELRPDDYYHYDFERAVDYAYPIEFTADEASRVEYFQPDVYVDVPISFISRLSARMEELYDR